MVAAAAHSARRFEPGCRERRRSCGSRKATRDYGFAVEGIAQYALYLLNRLYRPDRSVQEFTALAVYTITETASHDG